MRVGLRFAVACALLVTFAAGCTCMQKPWGMGALAGGGAGAVGGGIATGAASNNTGAFDIGNDNEDKALAIATGVIGGCGARCVARPLPLGRAPWSSLRRRLRQPPGSGGSAASSAAAGDRASRRVS